jgi:hypothetical protein
MGFIYGITYAKFRNTLSALFLMVRILYTNSKEICPSYLSGYN